MNNFIIFIQILLNYCPLLKYNETKIQFFFSYRQRLQELETEGERLDQSFQTYLQRQVQEKRKLDINVTKIWENYNIDRQFLNQTEFTTPKKTPIDRNTAPVQSIDMDGEQPPATPHVYLRDLDDDDRSTMSPTKHFQNPFRQITIDEIRLKKPSRIDSTRKETVASKTEFKPKSDTALNCNVNVATVVQSHSVRPARVTRVQQHQRNPKVAKATCVSSMPTMVQEQVEEVIESIKAPSSPVLVYATPAVVQHEQYNCDCCRAVDIIVNVAERPSEAERSMSTFSDIEPKEGPINEENQNELDEFDDIVHQMKPISSNLTYTVGRNNSNDFIADEGTDNNNDRSVGEQNKMSIENKENDSSDDFWR